MNNNCCMTKCCLWPMLWIVIVRSLSSACVQCVCNCSLRLRITTWVTFSNHSVRWLWFNYLYCEILFYSAIDCSVVKDNGLIFIIRDHRFLHHSGTVLMKVHPTLEKIDYQHHPFDATLPRSNRVDSRVKDFSKLSSAQIPQLMHFPLGKTTFEVNSGIHESTFHLVRGELNLSSKIIPALLNSSSTPVRW